ncbi:MAG: 50S ribosomal protein L29 [Desulfohalobiaceae bacterium]|nr:50S ribosomal protein L29 [Desulfohalobiaceae bacterium]
MKAAELRDLSEQELRAKEMDFGKELFNLRFQHATGQLENTQRIAKVKKNIARIKTILRRNELEKGHE